MNVGEVAAIKEVQQPRGDRCAKVLVKWGHGSGLDVASEARSHHIFVASMKALHKRLEVAEVVGTVGVAHQDVLAANERKGIDIGASQSPLRRFQHSSALRQRHFRRRIGGAVDDKDLTPHLGAAKTFLTPVHELCDGEFLVESWNDDGKLRLRDVIGWNQQLELAVLRAWL